ncbi:HD domain-containing protein [Sporanaerobium hydrogeniformans]|uniref:HD domain-containing protein n=1 Tax=Sporanaerobium hydrogeniformans TaxID=3072179 RepID=UPI0015D4A0D7|nr:HD domain-containing protein [Sporanaerobium hydrogeniformans]
MFYRIKQFTLALTAKINKEDQAFINQYLDREEQKLFALLKVYEQKHAIRVAQGMATSFECDKEEMIRLGLLHDIGKIQEPLSIIEKSIMVLLHHLTRGNIKKLQSFKMIRGYYNHPQYGYELLKKKGGYAPSFLENIRDHHLAKGGSKCFSLLQEWDDKA